MSSLPEDEQLDRAREVALRMLTASACTRGQVGDGLLGRGFAPRVVEGLLDRFEEVGLLDDAAYAERLVRARRDERGLSRRAIAAELARKGVDGDVTQSALAGYEAADETETAVREALARLRRTAGLEEEVRRRRTFAALARKGYGPETAREAVSRALVELATQDAGASDR